MGQTTSEYIQANWGYFGQTWRSVGAAIKHYQKYADDLDKEVVGVNAFQDRQRIEERDVSSARVLTTPRPNRSYNEIIDRIRQLHDLGADPETIQRQIGPVPELSGIVGDMLAITSLQGICGTAKPIWSSLVEGMKVNHE